MKTTSIMVLACLISGCGETNNGSQDVLILNEPTIQDPDLNRAASNNCEGCETETCEPVSDGESVQNDEERLSLNLYDPRDNEYAWRKTRGSLNPDEDVVFYWSGYIYNLIAKDPDDYRRSGVINFAEPLFRFEGFNVARIVEQFPGEYMMLSREVSVYQHPRTGRIIDCWTNSIHPERMQTRVLHVANDPVNFSTGGADFVQLGDRISFFSDILLSYRSPLAGVDEYESFSASDVYQSSELFNFIVDMDDLENPNIESAPVEISWTRVGQYLPWMQMGDTPGHLVYHVRGYKMLGGVDELPSELLNWTMNEAGTEFLTSPQSAPANYTPNATTWRVFESKLNDGTYSSDCP